VTRPVAPYRWRVRAWLRLEQFAERHVTSSYNKLVGREGRRSTGQLLSPMQQLYRPPQPVDAILQVGPVEAERHLRRAYDVLVGRETGR
jgi:hypothetical protein